MGLLGLLLFSAVVYSSSASAHLSQQSSLQSLLNLVLSEKREVPTVLLLKSVHDEKKKPQEFADAGAEEEDKHYWLQYLLRSQKGSERVGHEQDDTPNDLLKALRKRCQQVDKCAKKCPKKKKQCKKTCQEILDQENYCEEQEPEPACDSCENTS